MKSGGPATRRPEGGSTYKPKPAGTYEKRTDSPRTGRPEGGTTYEKRPATGSRPEGGRTYEKRPSTGSRPESGRTYEKRPATGRPDSARGDRPVRRREDGYDKPAPVAREIKAAYDQAEDTARPQDSSDEMVIGINPVLELLRSGSRPIGALLVDKDKGGPQFEEMIRLARKSNITLKVVPRSALDNVSNLGRHQGVVASVAPKPYADPHEMVADALKKSKTPLIILLDGVEDPHNLGAVIRTAESCGADGIVIPEHRAAHLTAAVSRASAGALEHMPVAKVANLVTFIEYLKEQGFWSIGLAGEAAQDYTTFDLTTPLAVVVGSEGTGIRPIVRKACDMLASIPMLGKVSSLNVSVATGIILYEAVRQRRSKG